MLLRYQAIVVVFLSGLLMWPGQVRSQLCKGSLGDPVVSIDFGRGPGEYGPALPGTSTNYNYVASKGPPDGSYTITKSVGDATGAWAYAENHTPNDPDGYMMMINASFEPGIFYEKEVEKELCSNTTYEFAAWVVNLLRISGNMPNLTFYILDLGNHELGKYSTDPIPGSQSAKWEKYGFQFTTGNVTKVKIRIVNNAPGGAGNDLAIDDITFSPCGPKLSSSINNNSGSSKVVCLDDETIQRFDVEVEGSATLKYQWQSNNGNGWTDIAGETSTSLTIDFKFFAPGNYQYRLVAAEPQNFNSASCRTASDVFSILISQFRRPVARVDNANPKLCQGFPVQLHASGGTSYKWSPAYGLSATDIANPIASPDTTTTYNVTVSNGSGCDDVASVNVTVFKKIAATAGGAKAIKAGDPVRLDASVSGDHIRYFWTPADDLDDPTKLNPIATPLQDITYTLHVLSQEGCEGATASIFIKVYAKIEVPNAFSPNEDGVNDVWNIAALDVYPGVELKVFDRYGSQVFAFSNNNKSWNGKYKGVDVPVGTYYYIIDAHDGQKKITGTVTILR